jgi:protein tyrosine phosphatase (PTP) superfamily phosphohydrolase (DUF442 family)
LAAPANQAPAPVATPELPPKPADAGVSLAPGISRFRVVEPQLAGGCLPTAAGWAFLVEKGYKTVLDLRDRSEVQPADVAAADHAGLRYVALPITAETLDIGHVNRFQEEITLAGARPLFFFDSDGSRAAVMWYVRQAIVEKVEVKDAARDAEEIGPKIEKYWIAAATLLDSLKPAAPPADTDTGSLPAPAPEAASNTNTPTSPNAAQDAAPVLSPVTANSVERPAAAPAPTVHDPNAWRPFASMLVAMLGLPLAYFGRSAFSLRSLVRASLPAPAPRLKSLPGASGE